MLADRRSFAALLALLAISCAKEPTKAPTAPQVEVTPAHASVKAGETFTFIARVTNASDTTVSWSVREAGGGSIDAGGVYTAPQTAGTFTVIAASTADPTARGSAQVTVTEVMPEDVVVTVTPETAEIAVNDLQQFNATVTGTADTGITWSVEQEGGGTVDATGLYQAPAVAGQFRVVATSVADPSRADSALVTVKDAPPGVQVVVSPPSAKLLPQHTQQFTATVSNAANTAVTWSVMQTGGGTIDGNGLYSAPTAVGTYDVVATSVEDPTRSDSAQVVVEDMTITIAPKQVDIHPRDTQIFTGTVTGVEDRTVTWSVQEAGGGSIDANGRYTAPDAEGTFHVIVTASADPTRKDTATVRVALPIDVDPSGLLGSDRATIWEPGLQSLGGIPARAKIFRTVSPGTGDDTSRIQSAIDACPAGEVVELAAGTFDIDGGNYLEIKKGITLRGAGPTRTILQKSDGAKPDQENTGSNPSPLIIIGPSRYPANEGTVSANLAEDGVKGSRTATVDSATGFQPGEVVLVDELSGATWQPDPAGRGQILAAPDWRVVWQRHNPDQETDDPVAYDGKTIGNGADAPSWFSRQDRVTSELKKVESVSGKVITFTSPLHISYRSSHKAQVTRFPQDPHVSGAGVESLAVIGGDNGNIRFERASECWARDIDNSVWHDEGFAVNESFRIEIRDFYVHDAGWAQPGGAGYAISLGSGSAEILIENGISVRANKVMVSRCSGAGSVVGYNYMDMGYINTNGAWMEVGLNASHMVGPHHVLFEGNYGFNADSDKTHGNSIYHTFFRNQLRGIRAPFTNQMGGQIDDATQSGNGPRRCAGLGYYSYWMSFVGNVLGAPGEMAGWVYETHFGDDKPGIWMLGWDDWSPYPTDPMVLETTLRHGNYDYLTKTVKWDPTIDKHDLPPSLYLKGKPAFFNAGKGYTWPWVDPTAATPVLTLPAKARYDAGTPFVQP